MWNGCQITVFSMCSDQQHCWFKPVFKVIAAIDLMKCVLYVEVLDVEVCELKSLMHL